MYPKLIRTIHCVKTKKIVILWYQLARWLLLLWHLVVIRNHQLVALWLTSGAQIGCNSLNSSINSQQTSPKTPPETDHRQPRASQRHRQRQTAGSPGHPRDIPETPQRQPQVAQRQPRGSPDAVQRHPRGSPKAAQKQLRGSPERYLRNCPRQLEEMFPHVV